MSDPVYQRLREVMPETVSEYNDAVRHNGETLPYEDYMLVLHPDPVKHLAPHLHGE